MGDSSAMPWLMQDALHAAKMSRRRCSPCMRRAAVVAQHLCTAVVPDNVMLPVRGEYPCVAPGLYRGSDVGYKHVDWEGSVSGQGCLRLIAKAVRDVLERNGYSQDAAARVMEVDKSLRDSNEAEMQTGNEQDFTQYR